MVASVVVGGHWLVAGELLPPRGYSRKRSQGGGLSLAEGARAPQPSLISVMLQLSSLTALEGEGPRRFIMGLWCLLIHNGTVFDRQPKIKANKGLWEGGLNNFLDLRTKKKVSK